MMYVDFYKLHSGGKQEVIARCKLVGENVICEGSENLVGNLNTSGIIDYTSQDALKLFPKDGLKFLEQLKYNFKSGYLNASNIFDEE